MTLQSPTCTGGRGGEGRKVMRVQTSSGPRQCLSGAGRPALHSHLRPLVLDAGLGAGMATPELCFAHKDRVRGAVPTLAAFLPPASPLSLALCLMLPPWGELGLRETRPCCPHTPHSLVVHTLHTVLLGSEQEHQALLLMIGVPHPWTLSSSPEHPSVALRRKLC